MFPLSYKQRFQAALVLGGACLGLYFLLVFRPLAERARALDHPLTNVWGRFVAENPSYAAIDDLNLAGVESELRRARTSQQEMEKIHATLVQRHQTEPEVRSRMEAPFQLVDFQNERQQALEELAKRATEYQVTLHPGIATNLPHYTAENRHPASLWGQLWLVQNVLDTAIRCRVPAIESLSLSPVQPHLLNGQSQVFLREIPIRLELAGPMPVISKFLLSLPMNAAEIKAAGLPESAPVKPPFLISKLMLRKTSPQKLDEVKVDLEVTGFLFSQ